MKPTTSTAPTHVLEPALQLDGRKPNVLHPTPPSQACASGSAWSFSIRTFGAGERFGGSNERHVPSHVSPRSVTPIALQAVAPEAQDVLVILGAAAHSERLRVERTDVCARVGAPRLLVWSSLARISGHPVPDGRDTEQSESARLRLTGPAVLLGA